MISTIRSAALASVVLANACGPDLASRQRALEATLASERQAHLEVDAERIAQALADPLVVVADGSILQQTPEEVRAQFAAYFEGASYARWDDVTPPITKVSPDGSTARVHRHVAVERIEPGIGTPHREVSFESAWTATYAWAESGWRMTSVTSTFLPRPSTVDRIVAAARRRTGTRSVLSDSVLRAVAQVEGPTGSFRVAVHSRADGAARIDFDNGMTLSAFRGGGWVLSDGQLSDSLDTNWLTFLRGHEVHMTLLNPASRLQGLAYAGRVRVDDEDAIRLVGRDALGGESAVYFSLADTLPLGYQVTDHVTGNGLPVRTSATGWGEAGPAGLATTATFRQGSDVFRYTYIHTDWLAVDPAFFEDPQSFDVTEYAVNTR